MKESSKDQRPGAVSFRLLAGLAAFCALPILGLVFRKALILQGTHT